jgi:DNA-binding transcriptional regulator YiaG
VDDQLGFVRANELAHIQASTVTNGDHCELRSARRGRNRAETARLLAEMPLAELRQAQELTQTTIAELLETSQGEVSKIEKRTDMYVSTLRRYIESAKRTARSGKRRRASRMAASVFKDERSDR